MDFRPIETFLAGVLEVENKGIDNTLKKSLSPKAYEFLKDRNWLKLKIMGIRFKYLPEERKVEIYHRKKLLGFVQIGMTQIETKYVLAGSYEEFQIFLHRYCEDKNYAKYISCPRDTDFIPTMGLIVLFGNYQIRERELLIIQSKFPRILQA